MYLKIVLFVKNNNKRIQNEDKSPTINIFIITAIT